MRLLNKLKTMQQQLKSACKGEFGMVKLLNKWKTDSWLWKIKYEEIDRDVILK